MTDIRAAMRGCLAIAVGAFAAATVAPAVRAAEAYPSRPIEFIVPWGPGGGSDQTGRQVAKLLEAELKTSLPVVNSPGATGTAGLTKLLTAPADGYTMAVLSWDTIALLAGGKPQKWSPDDFIPLGIVIQLPSGFYAAVNGPIKSWDDAVKQAKAKPNQVRIAISGFGSPDHISINYFASKDLRFKAVPYADPGERYSSVLGGHIELLYSPIGNVASFVEGKQFKPILIFSQKRFPAFADTPTSVESGYDLTLPQRRAIIVRTGTPADRVKKLNEALKKAVATPEYAAFLKRSYAQSDSYLDTEASRKVLASDVAEMKKFIQAIQPAK